MTLVSTIQFANDVLEGSVAPDLLLLSYACQSYWKVVHNLQKPIDFKPRDQPNLFYLYLDYYFSCLVRVLLGASWLLYSTNHSLPTALSNTFTWFIIELYLSPRVETLHPFILILFATDILSVQKRTSHKKRVYILRRVYAESEFIDKPA